MRRLGEVRRCGHGTPLHSVGSGGHGGVVRGQGACHRAEESVVRVAGREERQGLLDDLRALVMYLEANPRLPVGEMTRVEITYFPEGCDGHQEDEVLRLAGLLGVMPQWEGAHYACEKRIGQAAYRVVSIPEGARSKEKAFRWGW